MHLPDMRHLRDYTEEVGSMRPTIGGRRVPCRFCRRPAKIMWGNVPVCGRCLRAFACGWLTADATRYERQRGKL